MIEALGSLGRILVSVAVHGNDVLILLIGSLGLSVPTYYVGELLNVEVVLNHIDELTKVTALELGKVSLDVIAEGVNETLCEYNVVKEEALAVIYV